MAKRKRKKLESRGQARKQAQPTPRVPDASAPVVVGDHTNRWMLLAGLTLLSVMAFLPYWQVVGFDFLNNDDLLHVSKQPAVLAGLSSDKLQWALTETPSNLWHPVTWWSFMLEVEWFSVDAGAPGVHHVGNLLLHLANCTLTWSSASPRGTCGSTET